MIELFDGQRLLPRRDHSPTLAAGVLVLGAGLIAMQALTMQHQLAQTRHQAQALKALLDQRTAAEASLKPPSAEILADLRRQAERLEAEVTPSAGSQAAQRLPSEWLGALAEIATREVGVTKAEIARDGTAILEGQALDTRSVTAFLSAWERHPRFSGLQARALELREDKDQPGLLRFVLRTVPNESVPSVAARTAPAQERKP